MAGFADHVRIKPTELTERLGVARREGVVHGFTTPSSTGISVIGSPKEDYALNVYFDDANESLWFAEELVEFLDHGEGTVTSLDMMDTEFVRLANGEWQERPKSS